MDCTPASRLAAVFRRFPRLAAATLPVVVVLPAVAAAATWVVHPDGSGDAPDLQGAVAAAASGDTILLGPGTFTGAGNQALFILAKDLTFESLSGPDLTVIDCEELDRLMFVAQCSVVVSGVTVRRGYSRTAGGAISAQDAVLTLSNSRFERNSGGGDPFDYGGGGAVHVAGGTLDVSECRFLQNYASADDGVGGGLAVVSGANALIADTVFEGNSTALGQYSGGGGLLAWFAGDVAVERCTFLRNKTVEGGGAFLYADTISLVDCEFLGNEGTYAAQVTTGGQPSVVTDCSFTESVGGGLGIYTGAVVTDCTFVRNACENWGGAAYSGGAPATFLRCTFAGNSTSRAGGAVDLAGGNVTDFDQCTFVDNEAPIGGHIHTRGGAIVHLSHSVLTGGVGAGGAVACDPGGTVTASCCDVFGNAAGDFVGCLAGQDGGDGNFSADPAFCDEDAEDFTLRSSSPCAPPGVTGCGLVGAHPVACGPVSVEAASWGSLKSWYR